MEEFDRGIFESIIEKVIVGGSYTFVQTIHLISKSFGGINLEDIAAPRCFEIERRLKELCDIQKH